jgi:toluene monooxygenase system ferredoxin subunit
MVKSVDLRPVGTVAVCSVDQLWDGEMERFRVGSAFILLVRLNGEFHAYQARCPHQGVALSDGELDGDLLTCRAHRWQFNAANGLGVNPRCAQLKRFPVHVVDRTVLIDVELGESESGP